MQFIFQVSNKHLMCWHLNFMDKTKLSTIAPASFNFFFPTSRDGLKKLEWRRKDANYELEGLWTIPRACWAFVIVWRRLEK